MKEKFFKTGKASISGLVLGCPSVLWVGGVCGLTLHQKLFIPLVGKPGAASPWSAAASQVAGGIHTRGHRRLSLLEMVALSSSPGLSFGEDFFSMRKLRPASQCKGVSRTDTKS